MNNLLAKLERKYGKYAIHNISLVIIMCYAVGYVLQIMNADLTSYLTLNPYYILKGQVWRLFTWLLIPPGSLDIFTLLMLYFYYSIGTTLERTWGTFKYNVYLFSGMFFTILGAFILYAVYNFVPQYAEVVSVYGKEIVFSSGNWGRSFAAFSTYYVNMSIFLAFAATYPDMQVLFMMIIPLKVKVLGIVYSIMLVYTFIINGITGRIVIGASLLNFVVFFLTTRNYRSISPQQIKRRRQFTKAMNTSVGTAAKDSAGNTVITRHKCAICGRTELDDENLEFRFCSKCDGNYEYCSDHLYTHEHVHKM